MKQNPKYIHGFFKNHLPDSAIEGVPYLRVALDEFLSTENKDTAFAVYNCFFDCFRIHLEDGSFVDLLDVLLAYEENSSVLLDKQRDHLIHSVNVFVLGLSIFAKNARFRKAFSSARVYPYDGAGSSPGAEFLYRWGLASLLHDVGYPVEIIHNQFKSFITFVGETDGKTGADPFLDYFNFSVLDSVSVILFKNLFTKKFMETLPADMELDPLKPTHLIAYNFHMSFGIPFEPVKSAVSSFLKTMQENGFVDHGYYSALILLKWYGYLVQRSGLSVDVLYHPVLDCASAIFMHNYYRRGLMKKPFSLGKLAASKHPIGYLLILCDELQEWNRTAYGKKDKKRILAEASEYTVTGDAIKLHYITSGGVMSDTFGAEKVAFLYRVLKIDAIFPQGLDITQTTETDIYVDTIINKDTLVPRPLLLSLEQMARFAHAKYVAHLVATGKEAPYPTWESLPDTLKYSNVRQARGVFSKLALCGLQASAEPLENMQEVTEFTPEQLEMLAWKEHDDFVMERMANGWTLGPKDVEKKISPYLIPYGALPEDIKDFDRNAVRSIFDMLKEVGLRVYRNAILN